MNASLCDANRVATYLVWGTLSFAFALSFSADAAAQDVLAYSFEGDLQGFEPNGGGTTVSLDTIGATEGTGSMKVAIVSPATFVGSVTTALDPAIFGDPPGLDHVTFDFTLPTEFGPVDGTGFAVIGVTVFGQTQDGTAADTQIDLSKELSIGSLAAGTYLNQRIELDAMVHPVTFEVLPFNEIFGTQGSDPDDIIPNSFQFYFNKTGTGPIDSPVHALTIYIDNIRFGTDPDAVPGDYNGNFIVDAADYTIWRDTLGSTTDLRANGDDTGASLGVVDAADYAFWKSQFGLGGGSGSMSAAAVPESASALLLAVALVCVMGWSRGRTAR